MVNFLLGIHTRKLKLVLLRSRVLLLFAILIFVVECFHSFFDERRSLHETISDHNHHNIAIPQTQKQTYFSVQIQRTSQ